MQYAKPGTSLAPPSVMPFQPGVKIGVLPSTISAWWSLSMSTITGYSAWVRLE